MMDTASLWRAVQNAAGEPVDLRRRPPMTYRVLTPESVKIDGVVAPPVYRRDLEKALPHWPARRVTDLPMSGVRTYVWGLLNKFVGPPGVHPSLRALGEATANRRAAVEGERRGVLDARAAGCSRREIAAVTGLSDQTIARILGEDS
jgi:hypothetical protein